MMTIELCSFEILTSFSDSTDAFMSGCLGQFSLTCNQDGPFHQIYGILVSNLPLLPKSAELSLLGTYCQLISSLSKIFLTLFRTNCLQLALTHLTSITLQCYQSTLLTILYFNFLKLTSRFISDYMLYV